MIVARENVRPGMWIAVSPEHVRQVVQVTFRAGQVHILYRGIGAANLELSGVHENLPVEVVPEHPKWVYVWNSQDNCYDLFITSDSDVRVFVNDAEVFEGGIVHVHAEREDAVKELNA